ncbi:MAG TPA: glutamate-5-semialdehyde dehydrogenase [Clostridiaceae bacterium]|jgi:glutamate-5-semialdehyde dehydrogenase|nr:glutamate-5-semialdehyde dehydrogenase [Clostridiaceae bacterium]
MSSIIDQAKKAKKASYTMFSMSSETKKKALLSIAEALDNRKAAIFEANARDMALAQQTNLAMPLQKRLLFDESKLLTVCEGLVQLSGLEDPVGKKLLATEMDDGLSLYRISCPIGVIGIIFESRPDALVQIASLCLKTGNAVFLKGGSEAAHTNRILAQIITDAAISSGLPEGFLTLLESREEVTSMLALSDYIDLIIPRGSNAFVRYIMDHSDIPVLGHADGVCHLYIHEKADTDMALSIAVDSKTQYVAVCNTAETLLVDASVADTVLPRIAEALKQKGVTLFGCEKSAKLLSIPVVSEWHHEYLDYQMSVKIVDGIDEAIDHINQFGSGHTDAIVTSDKSVAEKFMNDVDSGNVFWNCSTRFSDGFKYGFGAEVGVSTSKIHARGPVGLEGMVTYKYKLFGSGQIVDDYASGRKTFKHRPITD